MKITRQQQALLNAVGKDDLKQVKVLLKKRVKPDFPGKKAKTPLQEAIRNGHLGIVKALVDAGADVNLTNAQRDNPLDIAYAKGDFQIIKYLRGQGAREASDNYRSAFNSISRGAASAKSKKSTARDGAKTKDGSKKPARFYDDGWAEDWDDGWGNESRAKLKLSKPVQAKPAPEPKFTAEKLKDIFNAEKWVGKTQEMAKLWEEVPTRLKKKFDFEAVYAKAQQETIAKKYPKSLSLKPRPPKNNQDAPPAP